MSGDRVIDRVLDVLLVHCVRAWTAAHPNISRKVQGLYYAGGSTIPGIGIPMCLISAELVIKRLHRDRSTGPLPVPLRAGSVRENTVA